MTATLLLLFVPLSAPPETVSDQTVAAWVADLRSEDSTKQREAYEALVKAGPKAKSAVPALTKLLGEKGARYDYAAEILGAIGPDAKEAVPALMALLPKEPGGFGHGVERIAYALARIDGPKIEATRVLLLSHTKGNAIFLTVSGTLHQYPAQVVSQLITLCADKDAVVREKAAFVLGTLKEKPVQKVPAPSLFEKAGDSTKGIPAALEKMLADKNSDVQLAAARAITHVAPELTDKALACAVALATEYEGMIKHGIHAYEIFHPVPEKAAKVLIPLFDHSRDALRNWAINHASALPLREPIEDALKNGKTARTRQAAAMALGGWYSSGTDAVPALTAALKDGEFIVRFAAGVALIDIGRRSPANAAAIPVLIEGLQQKDEQVRLQASQYLLRAGPGAKDAIPALKKLLDDEKPTVRLEAALALVGIDKKEATGTVPALTEGLKLSDGSAIRAAKALAELGPVAKDAVPELVKHFDAKTPQLRVFAAEAAARIDPAQAPKATEVLIELLKDKKHRLHMVRLYSLVALQKIGPGAKTALPTLTELLKDDGPFHAAAALAMIAIDPDGKNPAFDWIRTALVKNPDEEDGYELMERLPELGAKAKPLVPELTALLKSKTLYYRKTAITTLGAIGPDAKDALPELKQQAEKDPRMDIRELATAAIKKIAAK